MSNRLFKPEMDCGMAMVISLGCVGSTAINSCGLTYMEVRDTAAAWATNRHLARCIKEIAGIPEPVSPAHYGPDVSFDCPWISGRSSTGSTKLSGVCPRTKYISSLFVSTSGERPVQEHVPGDGDWQNAIRFESQDGARVYAVFMVDGRIDLVQGGLNRMKFPTVHATCLERKCAEDLITETVEPYADVVFGQGSWQHNRTWSDIDAESQAFKNMRAIVQTDRYRYMGISGVLQSKIGKFATLVEKGPPHPNAAHVFKDDNATILRITRSDYRTMHEWVHPFGGRMLYVMVQKGDAYLGSTLFVRPPTNPAAVVNLMYI